jgi:RNA polymerase sigma-70 factor (ECF subfamily)
MTTTRDEPPKSTPAAEVERIFREEHALVFSGLVRVLGDFEAAEDALQEALVTALEDWPRGGVPERPAAWITTVARNAATTAFRRAAVARRKQSDVEELRDAAAPDSEALVPDDRLRLLFTCCHPALGDEASVALALRTMCGLPTSAIARLFFVPEPTIAQRLVRAKRKIRTSGVPFRVPDAEHLEERTGRVLHIVYLLFTEGHAPTSGTGAVVPELCEEAIRLARLLVQMMPTDAEARALYALMLLHHARRAARVDARGDIVPLEEQDRAKWDAAMAAEGARQLDEALGRARTGAFAIQAAIAALHSQAPRATDTDWTQIAALYEDLVRVQPSPAARLAGAVAMGMALGPEEGLRRIDALDRDGTLVGLDRVAAARADLLRRAGRLEEACAAYEEARKHARTPPEVRLIERRLASCRVAG